MLNDHADDDVIVSSEEDARYEATAETDHDAADPADDDRAADDQAAPALPQDTHYNGGTAVPPWATTAGPADPPSDAEATPVTPDVTPDDAAAMPSDADMTPVTPGVTADTAHTNGHGSGSAIPMPGAETPAAPAPVPVPVSVTPDSNWPQIQSLFVDDPHSAVEQAAAVAGGAVAALVAAAKNREQALRDTWQSDATGTEELRTALRGYRDLAGLSTLAQDL